MAKAEHFITGAKSYAPATRNEESTGRSGRYISAIFSGAIILILCSANMTYFESMNMLRQMAIHDSATSVVNTITDTSTNNSNQSQLSTFCQKIHQAQDYLEPLMNGQPNRKMVHAFVANSGHLPLLRNSLVSIKRLSTPWKSFIFALDDKLCSDLRRQSPELQKRVVCIDYTRQLLQQMEQDEPESYKEYLDKTAEETALNESATWGSAMHKVLINSKLYGLRDVLNCGLDVFLTDVDIVFLKDPRSYFVVGEDIIAQNDTNPSQNQLNMNSGFMYWRYTQQNLNLSQTLVKDMIWWHIDQARVNSLLFTRMINVTILHTTQFPNGAVLTQLKHLNDTVAVHANWNGHFDEKKEVLVNKGLWLID
jgi:Nucleotide-diphospho-sugar transferase